MTRFKLFGFLLPLAMAGGLALGLTGAPAAAHDCARHAPGSTHKHCDDVGGGTKYTVQLLDIDSDPINIKVGAFCLETGGSCGPVAVIASSDGALLVSEALLSLLLTRPKDLDVLQPTLQPTWDGVFNTCPGLFGDNVSFLTANNWRVKLAPVKDKVDQVRVQFIRATPDNAEVEVTLQLIDRGPFDFDGDDTFLPVDDVAKKYTLTHYSIFGSSLKGEHPRLKCDNTGDDTLERGIVLEIKLKP